MSKKLGDIDYTKEEYLNLGANYEKPSEGSNFAGKAELHIIDMSRRRRGTRRNYPRRNWRRRKSRRTNRKYTNRSEVCGKQNTRTNK